MKGMTIGQVARAADIGVETVRFYEREGLIAEPPRRASGYREYPADTVRRLRFIRKAKELGFTLKEIGELLELRVDPQTTCGDVRAHATAKITDIDDKIRLLGRMKAVLSGLVTACSRAGPTDECPILGALDDEDEDHARG